jgi:rhodanese-related sulfurtransferase
MNDITAEELKQRLQKGEAMLIIDVREPYEYEEYNLGAKLIPLGEIREKLEDLSEYSDAEIVVHCRSGARSAAAKAYMMQNGFSKVRSLLGGILAYQALD